MTQDDKNETSSVVRALIWDGICLFGDTATPDSVADYVMKRFDPAHKLSPLMAHAAWNGARRLAVEEMAWQESGPESTGIQTGLSAGTARLLLETAVLRARKEAQMAVGNLSKKTGSKM
ncbi:hypothetical protein [Methylocaldum szegediense]|uniref:Uncharacterized protein n=1 Tax=Methylocaldum szegediense TaxID=73780 RepID=A0ABN8XBQ6_9GAMM|nr:hypothetical protein [Methylocaldum szegediense]CAI8956028.1 conserved protein of unknown function [Methylocaldum szegediense]